MDITRSSRERASAREPVRRTPSISKIKLLRRDRMTCAYCGQEFRERDCSAKHPAGGGRRWSWMNLVTAMRLVHGARPIARPRKPACR